MMKGEKMQEREQIRNVVGALERHYKEMLRESERGIKGRMPLLNMCFCGPSGTEVSKKNMAKYAAQLLYESGLLPRNNVVEVCSIELKGKHLGKTTKNIEDMAAKAAGGVLFITDVCCCGTYQTWEAVHALIETVNHYKENLCIIISGTEEEIDKVLGMNPGCNRRFSKRIYFSKSAKDTLTEALDALEHEKREQLEEEFKNQVEILLNRRKYM